MMGFIKKQFGKIKAGVKDEYKHKMAVRKAEKESFREAELEEATKFGKKKASYKTQQKVKAMKQPKKSFEFKGFAGPTQGGMGANTGLADALLGSSNKKKGKKSKGIPDMRLF